MMDRMSLAEETEAGSSESVDRLLELVEAGAPDHAAAAKAFAAAYVRRLAIGGPPEHLAAEVLGAFRFAVRARARARRRARVQPDAGATTATSRWAPCWRPTATTGRSSSTP